MTRSVVGHRTDVELEERRREILEALGGDEDDIRRRAGSYQLTVEEDALADELASIDFLLWRD